MADPGDHLFGRRWRRREDGTIARTFGVRQGADRQGVTLLEVSSQQASLLHDHKPSPSRFWPYPNEAAMRAEWDEASAEPR